jgi:histidine ammonia-lyase
VKSKIGYGKNKDIFIKHVDLDELNLIVDGEKLTEARAAAMGEELAKEAHRILRLRQQGVDPKHQQ